MTKPLVGFLGNLKKLGSGLWVRKINHQHYQQPVMGLLLRIEAYASRRFFYGSTSGRLIELWLVHKESDTLSSKI